MCHGCTDLHLLLCLIPLYCGMWQEEFKKLQHAMFAADGDDDGMVDIEELEVQSFTSFVFVLLDGDEYTDVHSVVLITFVAFVI